MEGNTSKDSGVKGDSRLEGRRVLGSPEWLG